MAKRTKTPNEFYQINTYACGLGYSKLTNSIYFEKKEDAIAKMYKLFKYCYPHGFNCNQPDVIKADIESPRYHDGDCYLSRFYTIGSYCYELSTNYFEAM